jgi:hypothetical protein
MDISAEIQILATIQTGSVFYFEEEELNTTNAHFFVVLNKDPRTEELLILLCASSQVEKRIQIAQKLGFPPETLVFVSPAECILFTKDTVIDCNRVFEKTPQSLINKLKIGRLKVCAEILNPNIIHRLKLGVGMSSQISEKTKKMISP